LFTDVCRAGFGFLGLAAREEATLSGLGTGLGCGPRVAARRGNPGLSEGNPFGVWGWPMANGKWLMVDGRG